jgi:Replication protein
VGFTIGTFEFEYPTGTGASENPARRGRRLVRHLLVVPAAYLEADSPLYITQEEWAAMWRKALGADGRRIIDIQVTENHGEVTKYVTKPGGYLELTGEQWQCDDACLRRCTTGSRRGA